jgi:hypothetical protein
MHEAFWNGLGPKDDKATAAVNAYQRLACGCVAQ